MNPDAFTFFDENETDMTDAQKIECIKESIRSFLKEYPMIRATDTLVLVVFQALKICLSIKSGLLLSKHQREAANQLSDIAWRIVSTTVCIPLRYGWFIIFADIFENVAETNSRRFQTVFVR